MRLTPALKYQLSGFKWPVIIYYYVIYALLITIGVYQAIYQGRSFMSFGGFDGASIIFLFVVGLNSFKSSFHMFAANGVSRRTMFLSFIAASGMICAGMALIDSINALVIRQFVYYEPMVMQLFASRYVGGGFMLFAEGFLWMFFSYAASIMLGYFITTAYYRMNRPLKLIVSIGVPVLAFIILPILDNVLFDQFLTTAFRNIAAFCSGQSTGSPYVAMVSNAAIAAIAGYLSYLLARRATVKPPA